MLAGEIIEYRARLRYHDVAMLQDGGAKWRPVCRRGSALEGADRSLSCHAPADVDVEPKLHVLERQSDELSAPLNSRPVVELVARRHCRERRPSKAKPPATKSRAAPFQLAATSCRCDRVLFNRR